MVFSPPFDDHGVVDRLAATSTGQQQLQSVAQASIAPPPPPQPSPATATGIDSKQPSTPGTNAFHIVAATRNNDQENDSWLVNTPEHRPSRYGYGGLPFDIGPVTASNASTRSRVGGPTAAGGGAGITTGSAALAGGRSSKRWDESEHAPFSSLQQLLRSVEMDPPSSSAPSSSMFWPSSPRGSASSISGRRGNDDGRDAASSFGTFSAKRSVKRTIAHCLDRGATISNAAALADTSLMSPPAIKPRGTRKRKNKKKI